MGRAENQPGLFDPVKSRLADYTLKDWDCLDCYAARIAWNAATPDERRAWGVSIGMPHWPFDEEFTKESLTGYRQAC